MTRLLCVISLLFALPVTGVSQVRDAMLISIRQPASITGTLSTDLFADFVAPPAGQSVFQQAAEEQRGKSPLRAAVYSALVPGTGELYAESYWKAAGFFAAEVTLWVLYAVYDGKGDNRTDLFQAYADDHWSVVRYAEWIERYASQLNPDASGCGGIVTGGPGLPPWDRVDWGRLNECEELMGRRSGNGFTHRLPRRPDQQYYELIGKYPQYAGGWDDADEITPADIIQRRVSNRFSEYSAMRGKANDFYNVASIAASVLVINHVLSALDAAWSASRFNQRIKVAAHLEPVHRAYGTVEIVPTARMTIRF